jgi:two-component system OmpR family sensor kinase
MLAVEAVATVLILAALAGLAASVLWAFRERAANEARLRQFVADASHELRTPPTSIRGYAELCRAGGLRDGGDVDDAMRRMGQEARRMGLLVDDMLLLARLDQGRPIDLVAEGVIVAGDDHRLRQVIGERVRLEVADEGPGLEPDLAARVFERFFRADPARTRASGGSGLGLSIVAAVAEAHGGRVSVDTAPGAGARFVVELPLQPQTERIRTSVASGT